VAGYFLFRFGKTILAFQDSVEDALDVIDEKYADISAVCELPLFSDSREVKEVLRAIKATRDSLHQAAFSLTENFEEEVEND